MKWFALHPRALQTDKPMRRFNARILMVLAMLLPVLVAYAAGQEYTLVGTWGKSGSAPGEFRDPMGIAVGPRGHIFVADSGNYRVQKFTLDGRFLLAFGQEGDQPGEFDKPIDVAVSRDGTVYVSDFNLDRVQAFSAQGRYLFGWGRPGDRASELASPTGIEVSPSGNVYIAEFYNHRIQVFDPKGKHLRLMGGKGHGKGQLFYPTDLAFLPDGGFIVADAYNHRLQWFTAQGQALKTWGWKWYARWLPIPKRLHVSPKLSHLNVPSDVAVGADGSLHITDSAHKRLLRLSSDGHLIGQWKLTDDSHPTVYSPTRVAVGSDGRIFAVDTSNDRIIILKLTSTKLDSRTTSRHRLPVRSYAYVRDTNR